MAPPDRRQLLRAGMQHIPQAVDRGVAKTWALRSGRPGHKFHLTFWLTVDPAVGPSKSVFMRIKKKKTHNAISGIKCDNVYKVLVAQS